MNDLVFIAIGLSLFAGFIIAIWGFGEV